MNATRLKHFAIRATTLGALLVSTAGVAMSQAKPAGPPATTKGTVKSNPKADKGQATAETARADARNRKAEKSALSAARGESKSLLKGIKFTADEKKAIGDIEKRYSGLYGDLRKTGKSSEKAGMPDAAYLARIDALRLQERAEVRAVLTPEQQIAYDNNIATLGAEKK